MFRIPNMVGAVVLCVAVAACEDALAATRTWDGGAGNWTNHNWSSGQPPPGNGDQAVIGVVGSAVLLSEPTADLSSFSMSSGILIFTNWTTRLSATNVSITGGTVDLPPAFNDTTDMSNRVWFVCSNFFLGSSALIDANGAGYGRPTGVNDYGYGPGAGGSRAGAGHGGFGGNYAALGGTPYGSVSAPTAPGSGGGPISTSTGGEGGGAIRIEASGLVTVNGTIRANGILPSSYAGAGSGGSIYVTCSTFAGTNGTLVANGATISNASAGAGGGGRIAVIYNTTAQSGMPVPTVTFSARPGVPGAYPGDIGTLYFPDTQFVTETMVHSGYLMIPGFTSWSPSTLTINNGWIRFATNHMEITVAGDVLITGANAALDIGGRTFYANGIYKDTTWKNFLNYNNDADGPTLRVGGDLIVTNSAKLYVYSAATNGTDYGALVSVTGEIAIASGSKIYLASHPTNGGSVLVQAQTLTVLGGGTLSADAYGYAAGDNNTSTAPGFGPGAGANRAGAGYGGYGGNMYQVAGLPYGSLTEPKQPGSGGGNFGASRGGAGGGLVWCEINGTITVNGTIRADGGVADSNCGGGSGGAVYLTCNKILGSGGMVRANGGNSDSSAGNGGGGRIAVIYDTVAQAAEPVPGISFSVLRGEIGTYPADIGTLYFPDSRFVESTIDDLNGQIPFITNWAPNNLTINSCWVRFTADNFSLHVTNDLMVTGNAGTLQIGGGSILTNGTYVYPLRNLFYNYSETTDSVYCRNLILTNGGALTVYSGPTNSASTNYGAIVEVLQDVSIASNSVYGPRSHPTDGGSVFMSVRDLTLAQGGTINADRAGCAGGSMTLPSDYGFGLGGGGSRSGGSYGGLGKYTFPGQTYGSSNAPVQCGSGGGSYGTLSCGGPGGGLVWIEAVRTMTLDGVITADGREPTSHAGGGSGGGIYLSCNKLFGVGSMTATGGDCVGTGGGGGGGRIAVWRRYEGTVGMTTDVSGGFNATYPGDPGTVVWGWLPIIRGFIIVVR